MRFHQLDFFRGLCLLLMTFNHLLSSAFREIYWLRQFTSQPFGFFNAAEGFILISGILLGFIYSKKYFNTDFKSIAKALLPRFKKIYFYHALIVLVLFIFFTVAYVRRPSIKSCSYKFCHPELKAY